MTGHIKPTRALEQIEISITLAKKYREAGNIPKYVHAIAYYLGLQIN